MPRDGRAVVSVHEVTQLAMKALVTSDKTEYNSYDDLCREMLLRDPNRRLMNDDLLEAVRDGRMRLVDVLQHIDVESEGVPEDIPVSNLPEES